MQINRHIFNLCFYSVFLGFDTNINCSIETAFYGNGMHLCDRKVIVVFEDTLKPPKEYRIDPKFSDR